MVSRAPAQVAFEAKTNVFLGWIGDFFEKTGGGHDHARGAVATLQSVIFHEGLLHRMQGAISGSHTFDGGDGCTIGLDGEQGATLHRFAIDVEAASATRRCVTANVGASQSQNLAHVMHEQSAWLYLTRVLLAVDGDPNFHGGFPLLNRHGQWVPDVFGNLILPDGGVVSRIGPSLP